MKSGDQTARILPWRPRSAAAVETEFLPAALEIVETPASPAGRAIALAIAAFFTLAIAWACLSPIDIVATAPGKIVPTGGTKIIQPFDTGVVRAIEVKEGQAVKAGDVLVQLDPTISQSDKARLTAQLIASELDASRLTALLATIDGRDADIVVPDGAAPSAVAVQRSLLASQLAEYRAKIASLDQQIAGSNADRAAAAAEVQKLTLSIPLLRERVAAFKKLYEDGWGQKLQYLELEQDLVEHEQSLNVQKAKLDEANAALAALQDQRRQTEAEFRRTNSADLADAETKAAGLQQQVIAAQEHQKLQTLTAPVAGTVQDLAIHTVGGVVTPAQQLMSIVPVGGPIEIDAMVSNRDIGFVHPGQRAEIKVATFDFTRYGLVHGQVVSVSRDTIAPPDKSAQKPSSADPQSADPMGQGLYAARISLDRTAMQVDGKAVSLAPGMAITAEIRTGSRHVIDYLLSPLLRFKEGALRER